MLLVKYVIPVSIAALLLGGCSHQDSQTASNDLSHGVATVSQEATKIGAQAGPVLTRLNRQAQPQLTKLNLGLRVTAALRANSNLPDTIRVDADTDGVKLRGSVKNHHQKALASEVAKTTLPPGMKVTNQLAITNG